MNESLPAKLNLGSGWDYKTDYLNVDVNPDYDSDRIIDLEQFPWDLPTAHFEKVVCQDVFEHINPRKRLEFLSEIKRVLKEDSTFIITLPVPEVGAGWNVTHFGVPSWRWIHNSKRGEDWDVQSVSSQPVWFGRFLPDRIRRAITRVGIRCIAATTVVLTPRKQND